MDAGVELTESERSVAEMALDFPNTSPSSSPQKLPRRLRQRILDSNKSPPNTAQDIEAKLKEADLRRQQFYEFLSSKARQKPRSSSWSALQEEDLGLRLEAKFNMAEQKRLSILAKVQKRLASLDELRKAAKSGVVMRFEKERDELGMKVESRVRQAEANRMLLLKAHIQQRDAKKERIAQSLTRRLIQESNYKESLRAAIYQKRAAAEKKRLGLLEAEKSRVRERILRVRQVAKSVFSRREIERRRLNEQLEGRLQRAQRLRDEYLKQRGGLHYLTCGNLEMMVEQEEILSRKLASCWKQFVRLKGTTLALAKAYLALEINERSVKLMPFEKLALQIESATTLQTVKTLLDRLESRIILKMGAPGISTLFSLENIDHLLKRVASPNQRGNMNNSRSGGVKRGGFTREVTCCPVKLLRYPVRVVLCAYMILGHPDAVFCGKGEQEIALAEAAESFIRELELLIKIVVGGLICSTKEETVSTSPRLLNFRCQLEAFDKAWCSYLYCFVVWKVKDAKLLEEDLVRAACKLERSVLHTCKRTPEGDNAGLTLDMRAVQNQVSEYQKHLREKVQHLSGSAGLERMECALSGMQSRYIEAKETLSSVESPNAIMLCPSSPVSSDGSVVHSSDEICNLAEGYHMPESIVQTLLKTDDSSPSNKIDSLTSRSSLSGYCNSDVMLATDNETLVNEIVHGHRLGFADGLEISSEDQEDIKARLRETMERAFWDGIMETMKQDEPDYSWVLKLMKEVRDELCEMSPSSWRQEIVETIDVDILSQVMKSGILNMDYFGKILEFALAKLQNLSAPANEDQIKTTHNELLKELGEFQAGYKSNASIAVLMIKSLRFVLQEIQTLKKEISKARIRILEPFVKGPAGLEYLRKAFTNRYGSPTNAPFSLPKTGQWLCSVRIDSELEWNEYMDSLSALSTSDVRCSQGLPPTTLRTGGSILMASKIVATSSNSSGLEEPECKGEKVDLLLRLGLLKLVSEVEGLTMGTLPETLGLNLHRLRAVQSQFQKIIVISTSILVLRQTFLSENLVTSSAAMEIIVSESVKQLSGLLDSVEDAGIAEVVETLCGFLEGSDPQKLQGRKEVIANTLAKSLRAGDSVFAHVSRTVYLAARGIVLGGGAVKGRQLAEGVLRRIGSALLTERLVEAVKVLVLVATVSGSVHGAWYEQVFLHA